MGLKDLLDRIKLSFCCKSKCSLNEIVEQVDDVNEWVDTIQDDIKDVVAGVQQSPLVIANAKQYNYYSKKEY